MKLLQRISENNENILSNKGLSNDGGIEYLREKLFLVSIEVLIVVGFLAYVPSIILAIAERQYAIICVDTLLMLMLIVLYFLHRISIRIRLIILLILLYLLGVVLLISLGYKGTGLIYLLAFSVIASTFMGIRIAFFTILINLFTLVVLAIFVALKLELFPLYETYKLSRWMVVSINFIVVNSVISLAIAYFVDGLKKSIEREEELKKKLRKKSERLIEAKVKAEESDQLKTSFLANVSHEFRTPMNAIIGFTEIMLYTDPDKPKRMRYLQNIQKSSEQLLQIIHNTIEYSKIELGKIDLTPARFDIYEILDVIYENLKPNCPPELDFIMSDYLKNDGTYIISDRQKLTQIFSNLIINAFKFTETGSVSFGLMESAHRNYYQFYVKDTGIGIRKEKQKDIFTRFHKEDDFKEGTGLGLAISATLLFHMGGRIWLESEPGVGTTFYFILPVELAPEKDIDD